MPDISRSPRRTDEIGRISPEQVEHDFERDLEGDGPGVQRDEDLKNAERMPGNDTEDDWPFNDALGG